MANVPVPVRLTMDISKFTKTVSDLIISTTTENVIQPLSPLFPALFTDQYPMNLIMSNSMFSQKICSSCGKIYGSEKDLQDHVSVHHERKFECEKCARTFLSEKRLRAHELKKHTLLTSNFVKENIAERKLFQCNQCDRTYETFYNFKEHMAKHEGKLFRCTVCNKYLSGQSALSRHSKIHEKPHECMMCTSRFSSAYDLDCHFSYYHSTVKRFKCLHCGRVLYNYSGKLRHERLCSVRHAAVKKASDSSVGILQDAFSHLEQSIRTVPKYEIPVKFSKGEKTRIIQNYPAMVNSISEVGYDMPKKSAEIPEDYFISVSKPHRRRTFQICDIMHDVPGFTQ